MDHSQLDTNGLKGLQVLRKRIEAANVPASSLDETLNIATWNIREFGGKRRLEASIHYIADILNLFDLVAITELNENLEDLNRVLRVLGPYWKIVYCDAVPDAGGNEERIGFVYDGRAVRFTGLAAEADPERQRVPTHSGGRGDYVRPFEWWRPPFMASFCSGDFDFVLLAAHIRWGNSIAERNQELSGLADWVHQRRSRPHVVDRDIIVLGDFNITSRRSSTFKAVTRHGLQVAPGLMKRTFGSNLAKDKRYDQILHYPLHPALFVDKQGNYRAPAGQVDFYAGKHEALYPGRSMSKAKFTFEMSDHLPLWVQLNIWSDDLKLDQMLSGR